MSQSAARIPKAWKQITEHPLSVLTANRSSKLTPAEERELAEKMETGDADAMNKLVMAYMGIIISAAAKFARDEELSHYVQECYLHIAQKAQKFDLRRNNKFGTFVFRVAFSFCSSLKKKIERQKSMMVSLDDPIFMDDSETFLERCLSAELSPEEHLRHTVMREAVLLALSNPQISERERFVIQRILEGFGTSEIAKILSVTKCRVDQHYAKAKRKLRDLLRKTPEFESLGPDLTLDTP